MIDIPHMTTEQLDDAVALARILVVLEFPAGTRLKGGKFPFGKNSTVVEIPDERPFVITLCDKEQQ